MKDIEVKQQLEAYALTRKYERLSVLDSIPFGKRKTAEQTAVYGVAQAAHRLLMRYDACSVQPEFATFAQTAFDESVAQLTALCNPTPTTPPASE